MTDLPLDAVIVFDPAFGQELCDVFTEAIGYKCIFVEKGGLIVASSDRERIGTIHAAAAAIMESICSEYAVTAEEAKASGGLMREGLSVAIDFDGMRVISFGISGDLDAVTPLARIAGFCVRSILQARQVERQLVARYALETIHATEQLLEEMRDRATTDSLTGVWNRGRVEEAAQLEMLRLARYGHPVSMIFADLDHFKEVNDTYGHVVGDRVLRSFCDLAKGCIRSLDLFGRWGGEEFVIVTPNCGHDIAQILAERIRTSVIQHDFSPVIQVTASFGIAECSPNESFDSWLSRADSALYQAKTEGRNRVVVAGSAKPELRVVEHVGKNFVRLIWHARFASGDPVIDRQHRGLFDSANSLLDAVIGERPKDEITGLIEAFLADAATHFAEEEKKFHAVGYPEATEHENLHRAILDKAERLASQFSAGRLAIGDLFSFIACDVVAVHMLSDDRRFFPYLGTTTD